MKFVCLNCETYMSFEKVEKPAEGSLGVFFGCPSCGAKFSMVTNPGETQMVSSLGVQLGVRAVAAEPFEMTRGGLRGEDTGQAEMAEYLKEHYSEKTAPMTTGSESSPTTSGCPFSAVVAQMGLGSGDKTRGTASELEWSPETLQQIEKTPSFVRPMVKGGI